MAQRNIFVNECSAQYIYPSRLEIIAKELTQYLARINDSVSRKVLSEQGLQYLFALYVHVRKLANLYILEVEASDWLSFDTNKSWRALNRISLELTEKIDELAKKLNCQGEAQKHEVQLSQLPARKDNNMTDICSYYRADYYYKMAEFLLNHRQINMAGHILRMLQIAQSDYSRIQQIITQVKEGECLEKIEALTAQIKQKQMNAINTSSNSSASSSTTDIHQALEAESKDAAIDVSMLFKINVKFEIFGYVEIPRSYCYEGEVRKILAIDVDDTLVKDRVTSDIEFIFLDQWIEMFKKLPADVAVFVVTARMYPDFNVHNTESVISTLEEKVGKRIFHSIIYTLSGSKINALENLYERHLAFEKNNTRIHLALVDDNPTNVVPAVAAGFCAFHAKDDNSDHINQVAEFVKSSIPEEKAEQVQNRDREEAEDYQLVQSSNCAPR